MGDEKAEENLKKIKLPKTYVKEGQNITFCPSISNLSFEIINQPFFLSFSYVMSNGYKPAPLDLSHVKLTPNQNQLVEKLAENGHNVWARDRVRQGWTYSIVQVTSAPAPDFFTFFSKQMEFNFMCSFPPRTSSTSGTLVWCLTTYWTRELRKRTATA